MGDRQLSSTAADDKEWVFAPIPHTALAREEIERSFGTSIAIVSQLTINLFEADMAKRRNLKKEKAERNLAYARKFRKRTNTGRNMRSRMRPSNGGTSAEEDDTSSAAEG
jgi:hypothetical protein